MLIDDEQRWRFANRDTRRKLDECLAAIFECAQRPPCRLISGLSQLK
jgi:hypothetical protein